MTETEDKNGLQESEDKADLEENNMVEEPDLDSQEKEEQEDVAELRRRVDVRADNAPIQTEGIQNNYFNFGEREQSVREYKVMQTEQDEVQSVYVKHRYDETSERLFQDNALVIITGRQHVGRYTFAIHWLKRKGFSNIICIYEATEEMLADMKWQEHTGYVIRTVKDLKKFQRYSKGIEAVLMEKGSTVCVILEQEQVHNAADDIKEQVIQIDMPEERCRVIRNHIWYEMKKRDWIGDEEKIWENIEKQIQISRHGERISKAETIRELTGIAFSLVKYFMQGNEKLEEAQLDFILNKAIEERDITEKQVALLKDVQERFFVFCVACLNGFPKEHFYDVYRRMEIELQEYCSEVEKEQIGRNEFWALPWKERLNRGLAKTELMSYADTKDSIEALYLKDDYDDQIVIDYFLKEYDWSETVENWLIKAACDYGEKERREALLCIKGIQKISRRKYQDIQKKLYTMCWQKETQIEKTWKKRNYNALYVYAGFLREVYDNSDMDRKKQVLRNLHRHLTADERKNNVIGLRLCDMAFADIQLSKLEEDVFEILDRQHYMEGEVAYCLLNLIYCQEENRTAENSIFDYILERDNAWKNKRGILINYLVGLMTPRMKKYYDAGTGKRYEYPMILYIFGKNIAVRNSIIRFFEKSLSETETYDMTHNFFRCLYKYVQQHSEIPMLNFIYEDFASRLQRDNSFLATIIKGIQYEYEAMN